MQVQRIQNNYTPQFNGLIKFQNFKNGGNITELRTSIDLDRGLAQTALKNIFEGRWTNEGEKYIEKEKLSRFAESLRQTLGLAIRRTNKEFEHIERKQIDKGYSVKVGDSYEITHIREDQMVWD